MNNVDRVLFRLARRINALQSTIDGLVSYRQGTVTAYTARSGATPAYVTLDTGHDQVPCQGWYTPVLGDVVGVLYLGSGRWLCIGTLT